MPILRVIDALETRDENFILQRMLENIAFFETHNKNIAKALKNTLKGENKKYSLLFNKNEINIIDIQNNKFIYPKNSFINFSKNIAQNPLSNNIWKIHGNNITLSKIDTKNLKITSKTINEMVDFAYKNFLTKDLSLDNFYHLPTYFLPQTNIFGLCGGLFLQILLESGFNFHSLLIFEENLELFAISCYFINFKMLFNQVGEKSCYIFIENIVSKAFLNHYFYSKKVTNNFLRLELNIFTSQSIDEIKKIVNETYKANSRGWGSFEDEMIGIKNTMKNIYNYPVLNKYKKLNIPICVVGSGPSLESNIKFLKNNQHNMLIFSCGTALKILKNNNIKIDFQIEIERVNYLADILIQSNLDNTPILCGSVVDNKVLEIAKEGYLFLRGGSFSSYLFGETQVIEFCAPFVGNAGFSIACNFSDEIILCGIDCGYIKNKSKHSKGSFYGNENSEIPSDCFLVKANGNFEVYSDSIFSLSKENIESAIKYYKPKIVYNIGDGAFIKGSQKTQNIKLNKINKDSIKNEFLECFVNQTIINNQINESISKFINNLKNKLDKDIRTKQELFNFIDEITQFLSKESFKKPYCGKLFEGTILHLLQNMMICLLYAKTNDILQFSNFYSNAIKKSLDELLEEFQSANI